MMKKLIVFFLSICIGVIVFCLFILRKDLGFLDSLIFTSSQISKKDLRCRKLSPKKFVIEIPFGQNIFMHDGIQVNSLRELLYSKKLRKVQVRLSRKNNDSQPFIEHTVFTKPCITKRVCDINEKNAYIFTFISQQRIPQVAFGNYLNIGEMKNTLVILFHDQSSVKGSYSLSLKFSKKIPYSRVGGKKLLLHKDHVSLPYKYYLKSSLKCK